MPGQRSRVGHLVMPARLARLAIAVVLAAGGLAVSTQPAAATWEPTLTVVFLSNESFGSGNGHVTSDDGAIDCSWSNRVQSGDCSEHYHFPDFLPDYSSFLTVQPELGSSGCWQDGGTACHEDGAAFNIGF